MFGADLGTGRNVVGQDPFSSLTLDAVGQGQVTVIAQQIPEPATALLLVGGLFAIGMKKTRRAKN